MKQGGILLQMHQTSQAMENSGINSFPSSKVIDLVVELRRGNSPRIRQRLALI